MAFDAGRPLIQNWMTPGWWASRGNSIFFSRSLLYFFLFSPSFSFLRPVSSLPATASAILIVCMRRMQEKEYFAVSFSANLKSRSSQFSIIAVGERRTTLVPVAVYCSSALSIIHEFCARSAAGWNNKLDKVSCFLVGRLILPLYSEINYYFIIDHGWP